MIKFESNNIFVGYLKQLLASFNLPTYRIYTEENRRLFNEHGREKHIVASIPSNSAYSAIEFNKYSPDKNTRYVSYIKNGLIQQYVKTVTKETTTYGWKTLKENNPTKKIDSITDSYIFNQYIPNHVRHLQIKNNYYDNYTHEYLGDFLRFIRDYENIDLMPLYNCFGNQICNRLKLVFNTETNSTVEFNTKNTLYKIYMLPVKMFKKYTIAIDCDLPIELCCGIYGKYQSKQDIFDTLNKFTYQKISAAKFNQPVLYTKLVDLADSIDDIVAKKSDKDPSIQADLEKLELELAQKEKDLKLFIKVPSANTSAITVLEGDYCNWNDKVTFTEPTAIGLYDETNNLKTFTNLRNHYVTNFENEDSFNLFKPITELQLLRANSGISHPFADMLIAYLSGNVIISEETLLDNILRVQNMLILTGKITRADGLWDNSYRSIFYDYLSEYSNIDYLLHDNLGFIDKVVEKYYKHTDTRNNVTTLENIDIYNNMYLEDK